MPCQRHPNSNPPPRRRRGKTAEQECMELVSTLPADQQRFVVSGFTDFSENLA